MQVLRIRFYLITLRVLCFIKKKLRNTPSQILSKMRLIVIVPILLFFNSVNCINRFTVEYYENLIYQTTAEAQVFEIPESNDEFRAGADSPDTNDFGSFDFIIVGAGSSGSVVATRLSEISDWKILLLEAGDEENDFNSIPGMFMFLQFTEMNWGYYSTPQTNCCLGMREKRCMAPRGKSIGGSSAINAMMYVRGNPKDYDTWAELGNPGWSFEEVLPYFLKSENSQIKGDDGYHGKGGIWNVEYSLPPTGLFSNFIEGNAELNVPNSDFNGGHQLGVAKNQINMKHGKRQSTGTAFLDVARKRENLTVVTRALVTKININETTKTAQGVTFITNNTKFTATATKEVIVSGGAYNSPQLLMLSGIGPKEHLEEIGIEVIEDLPVGENLMEHPLFHGLAFHTNYTSGNEDIVSLIEQYLKGYGPYTNPSNVDAIGFMHSGDGPEDVPMVEYLFIPPGGSMMPILHRVYNYDDELIYQYLNKLNPASDVLVYLALLHQKSRGRVTLKSSDPIDFPNIDLNLFSESEDVDNFIAGIEFVLKLMDTEAFRKINATLVDIPICQQFEKFSRDFWDCTIRHMSMTIYHPCGTTTMGKDKTSSVVDTNLKVHGIEKLRVVDAGVFPSTVSGHTNAPAVMVAEKISDVIKQDYNAL